jgi:hypothetical protein
MSLSSDRVADIASIILMGIILASVLSESGLVTISNYWLGGLGVVGVIVFIASHLRTVSEKDK